MPTNTGSYLQVNIQSSTGGAERMPYYNGQTSISIRRSPGYGRPVPSSFSMPIRQITPRRVEGGRLTKELTVFLSKDKDGRYLMVEPKFSMHGEGDTIAEAENAVLAALVAARYNLGIREDRLNPYMRRKLDFVKALIDLD